MDWEGRIWWVQPQVWTQDSITMVLLPHFPLWVSAGLLGDVCCSWSCLSFLGLAVSSLGSFLSLGETGAGRKIHGGPCHFSSGCHCFSKSLITFYLVKTRNEKHTFYQMTSLRLESVIVYAHPSLASLDGEEETCAYPWKSSAFSAWCNNGRSLGELTLASNACWL